MKLIVVLVSMFFSLYSAMESAKNPRGPEHNIQLPSPSTDKADDLNEQNSKLVNNTIFRRLLKRVRVSSDVQKN